ncbi:hypothetical protein NKG05_09755 [Oerskovia sp. M15]
MSDLDGYLSVFNLTPAPVTTTVTLPGDGASAALYQGRQVVTAAESRVEVTIARAARSSSRPARPWTSRASPGRRSTSRSPTHGRWPSPRPFPCRSTSATSRRVTCARSPSGEGVARDAPLPRSHAVPVPDLALSTLTFPASVLPTGMTSPSFAVDGDPSSAWSPGPPRDAWSPTSAPRRRSVGS